MSLHVIINGIEYRPVATLPAQSSQLPLCDTLRALRKSLQENDMMRAEIARLTGEIDRLRSIIEDCNPYLKDGEIPADRIRRDIRDNDALMSLLAAEKKIRERITGENAVLRDLLRDCLPVLETVSDDDGEDWMIAMALKTHIKAALDGHDADMLSDGEIYAAVSRRAAPEWHAEMDKLLGINDGKKMTTINVIINGIEYRPVATLPEQSSQAPLGDTLRALRKSARLTLQGAGDLAGITKSYLWGLEKAAHQPSLAVAKRLADLYGVSLLDLAACQTANSVPKQ